MAEGLTGSLGKLSLAAESKASVWSEIHSLLIQQPGMSPIRTHLRYLIPFTPSIHAAARDGRADGLSRLVPGIPSHCQYIVHSD